MKVAIMNRNPFGIRRTVQLMIVLTLLAWATQTLLHQWGFGAEPPGWSAAAREAPSQEAAQDAAPAAEKFVPGTARYFAGATLELRGEATVIGSEVKLRQICRWCDADKAAFEPVADLVLAHLPKAVAFRAISLDELKQILADAGVNMAVIRLAGARTCTVNRSDVRFDERSALQQWIDAHDASTLVEAEHGVAKTRAAAVPVAVASDQAITAVAKETKTSTGEPFATNRAGTPQAVPEEPKLYHTLRDLLLTDLSERLSLPVEALQVRFNPADEKALNLSEPHFRFNLEARRVHNLGEVSWDVTIVTDGGSQKTGVSAVARAWQQQVVVNKPMAYKQVIRDQDVIDRRALVDRVMDEPLLTRQQVVGQMAGRELRAGTIMTARLVEAVPLVRSGQLVTISLTQGNVQVKTVARALEGGAFGQTIRVKNEATRDVFEVICTAPQEARMSAAPADASPAAVNVAATGHD
jgi:flagella basal body P-ring formation protein FlgA